MSHPAITRAHSIVLVSGADTEEELAWELRAIADRIQRGEITSGCIGGSSSGSTYSYKVAPEQTHDAYFKQIAEWLESERINS
jgi:hypothetical protein